MKFDNTYFRLPNHFYSPASSANFSKPELISFNSELGDELGLGMTAYSEIDLARIFSGQKLLPGSEPISQAYAGHQFGHFVPQLGDGRAMLLGEVVDPKGNRFDIQLKGSGPTFFSRGGDGYSALGPVIREYIVSEAMHHLGVRTTRALAAVATGDTVNRETPLPGGVFTRVASSHIRIGTFQYFAGRGDIEGLRALLDYVVDRHYPEVRTEAEANLAICFLKEVIQAQASLISHWMSVGFIHGVMNTDNTSISGETIDYGPCAFMDKFSFDRVYSFIDKNGRYAYINQPSILHWNLSRLAECLVPLVDSDTEKAVELLNQELSTVSQLFRNEWVQRMKAKMGLTSDQAERDSVLIESWFHYLENEKLDFTLAFRKLADLLGKKTQKDPFFCSTLEFRMFEENWKKRLHDQGADFVVTQKNMNAVNPVYIPRNHQVERAIQQAIEGDYSVFNELNELLKNPMNRQPGKSEYERAPLPEEEIKNTFCGT